MWVDASVASALQVSACQAVVWSKKGFTGKFSKPMKQSKPGLWPCSVSHFNFYSFLFYSHALGMCYLLSVLKEIYFCMLATSPCACQSALDIGLTPCTKWQMFVPHLYICTCTVCFNSSSIFHAESQHYNINFCRLFFTAKIEPRTLCILGKYYTMEPTPRSILHIFQNLVLFYVCVFCLHVFLCTTWMPGTSEGQKRTSDPLELWL